MMQVSNLHLGSFVVNHIKISFNLKSKSSFFCYVQKSVLHKFCHTFCKKMFLFLIPTKNEFLLTSYDAIRDLVSLYSEKLQRKNNSPLLGFQAFLMKINIITLPLLRQRFPWSQTKMVVIFGFLIPKSMGINAVL